MGFSEGPRSHENSWLFSEILCEVSCRTCHQLASTCSEEDPWCARVVSCCLSEQVSSIFSAELKCWVSWSWELKKYQFHNMDVEQLGNAKPSWNVTLSLLFVCKYKHPQGRQEWFCAGVCWVKSLLYSSVTAAIGVCFRCKTSFPACRAILSELPCAIYL